MEIRSYSGIATPQTNGRKISGYAVVFGVKSVIMYDSENRRMFQEIIEPGAITPELLKRSDIKAVLYENSLLARSNKGFGTLTLKIDKRGLYYSFEAPDTTDGNDALEMIKRGDIFGSSFSFSLNENDSTWIKQKNGVWLRRINSFRQLHSIVISTDPAYNETTVTAERMLKRDNDYKTQLELLKRKI